MRSHRPYPAVKLTEFWPPDFTPAIVYVYERSPLDPLIVECESCKLRASCRADNFAKTRCALAETRPETKQRKHDAEGIILSYLRDGLPHNTQQIAKDTGLNYYNAFKVLKRLSDQGIVRRTYERKSNVKFAFFQLEESE